MVNYLTTKYAKRKGKNKHDTVYELTGLSRDRIVDLKRAEIRENSVDALISFCFGLGVTLEEAVVLAFHGNTLFLSDNKYARRELEIFSLLKNTDFMSENPEIRTKKARDMYPQKQSKSKNEIIKKYINC